MQCLQFGGSGRPNGGNATATEVAQIVKGLEEVIEKTVHTVRAGENQPLVGTQTEHAVLEAFLVVGFFNADGRDFQNIRT